MTSIVLAHGTVRAARPLVATKGERAGEVFGTEVALLTNVGDALGETLKVMIWERDRAAWEPQPGETVSVVVELDATRFGLQGTFKRFALPADLSKMPVGVPTIPAAAGK